MLTKNLISIGVTCFNARMTIERTITSALSQSWENIEIIAVDDCSTDGSWEKLKEFALIDKRIRIFRHDNNTGYPAALNTILLNGSGEFLAIFDSDDLSAVDRLRAQYRRIVDYEKEFGAQLVLCYSNRNVIKNAQGNVDHVAKAIGRFPPEPYGQEVADYVFGTDATFGKTWGMFGSCTLMARRVSFNAIGPFDEAFRRCAEWDYAVRAARIGASFIAVDRPLVTQYKTKGTYKSGKIPLQYSLLLREKHRGFLSQQGFYQASRFIARSNFYGNKRQYVRAYFLRFIAFACSWKLFLRYLLRLSSIRESET